MLAISSGRACRLMGSVWLNGASSVDVPSGAWVIGVSTPPGCTELTRMLARRVVDGRGLGQAAHGELGRHVGAERGQPVSPPKLEMFTIDPPPAAFIDL